jgi:hypothetical protein
MPQRFDPNIPNPNPALEALIGGDVTMRVVDPAGNFPPFEVGNLVLERDKPFDVVVQWKVLGFFKSLWLKALGGNWVVQLFAESVGQGPEIRLGGATVAADETKFDYEATIPVAANTLQEGDPNSDISGIYKLVVSVFLDSTLGPPGFDMIGFAEGPYIQVEDTA